MGAWKLQDAKARFSEFLEKALKKGPQVVTRRGVPMAVLLPIQEWKRMQAAARPGLKALLLSEEPRFGDLLPRRRVRRRRAPIEFE
ncbi:MAG: type II toxin-antitoxin system Phd/YefM family antitoxin [Candidatus Acidiferrales bacterium]